MWRLRGGEGASPRSAGAGPKLTVNYVVLYNSVMTTTFADADDDNFLSIVQAMADIDFDTLDENRLTRVTSTPENDPWYLR